MRTILLGVLGVLFLGCAGTIETADVTRQEGRAVAEPTTVQPTLAPNVDTEPVSAAGKVAENLAVSEPAPELADAGAEEPEHEPASSPSADAGPGCTWVDEMYTCTLEHPIGTDAGPEICRRTIEKCWP